MSSVSTARALPVERPRQTAPERRLHAVGAPAARRPRLAYALVALGGAVLIAGAQIGLTLATTQDSFVLADLTSQSFRDGSDARWLDIALRAGDAVETQGIYPCARGL